MASNRILLLLASVSAMLAFWFGSGLHPLWALAWLGPSFAFLAIGRATPRTAFVVACLIYFIAELNLWTYASFLPLGILFIIFLIPALAFGVTGFLFNRAVRQSQPWVALLAPACFWTTFEFGYAQLSPHGTFGSIAYSQANALPIVQLAAVGGIWLISFLIIFVSAGVAIIVSRYFPGRVRFRMGMATVLVAFTALVYGGARLMSQQRGPTLKVALIASDLAENMRFSPGASSAGILQRYLAQLPKLKEAGAQLVLLPEALLAMHESDDAALNTFGALDEEIKAAAARLQLTILVGVDHLAKDGANFNESRIYSANGEIRTYAKHHRLPPFENKFRPGSSYTTQRFNGQNVGFAICKDLDFQDIGRQYAQLNVALLAVPAFDFGQDAWLHSRMAIVRSVESGAALARTANRGALTISDNRGRIIAEAFSHDSEFATLVAECPLAAEWTVYGHFGDWFAWLCCVVLGVALLALFRSK